MNAWVKRALIAVPLLVVLFFAAIAFYVNVIRDDAPDELGTDDLAAAVAGDSTPDATTAPTVDPEPAEATATESVAADVAAGYDGTWTVTEESEFGYRVEEVLFGVNTTAAGRSNQIRGQLVIEGSTVTAADFAVDVASITSDDRRRDGQFTGNIMETAQFPEASFTLTEPIELGAVPGPGEQITAQAAGELTLHGVTRPVEFAVTAEAGAERIGVLGNIPIVFADYDIDNPSRAGITTEDHGLLEFVLVFERA